MQIIKWSELSAAAREECLTRPAQRSQGVAAAVEDIIGNIRERGDEALRHYSKTLDHYEGESLKLSAEEIEAALKRVSAPLKQAIETAQRNIAAFHRAQLPKALEMETFPGITCAMRTHPIDSVGLYVPGGSAPLISTALMLGVPAVEAGCPKIILCSPPPISDGIICAAVTAGIREIYNLGGAQAIAAMAYGTQTVPKVLKIFGPGNQYVTEAKRQVSNDPTGAAIEMPAGPSEVLVIADKSADPAFVAADLLSQAEHGPDSQVILLSDSQELCERTLKALETQLAALPRVKIATQALSHSTVLLVEDLQEACAISNAYAPEHLIVQTADPKALLPQLRNAGSVFLGAYTPEALGDYASGTNHTLPTYGYARTYAALGTADFCRRYTVQHASAAGLLQIGATVECLADAEGLFAHQNAVTLRLKALRSAQQRDGAPQGK